MMARAYFDAPSLMPTFVEICDEGRRPDDKGMCGELRVEVLHGPPR